jgi:hypothetical protein
VVEGIAVRSGIDDRSLAGFQAADVLAEEGCRRILAAALAELQAGLWICFPGDDHEDAAIDGLRARGGGEGELEP